MYFTMHESPFPALPLCKPTTTGRQKLLSTKEKKREKIFPRRKEIEKLKPAESRMNPTVWGLEVSRLFSGKREKGNVTVLGFRKERDTHMGSLQGIGSSRKLDQFWLGEE